MFWLLVIHKNKYLKKGFSLAVQIEITPDETLNSLGWTEGWEALQKCTEISLGWVDILFIASYNLTLIKVSRLKKKSFFVSKEWESEWLLFNAKWTIFKVYHDEIKLHSMKWYWWPLCTRPTCLIGWL